VCIPIGTKCTESELEYFVNDTEADLIVVHNDYHKRCVDIHYKTKIPIMNIGHRELISCDPEGIERF
jgi:malonyl-CoA/methylmalonyl-CoA synthetase